MFIRSVSLAVSVPVSKLIPEGLFPRLPLPVAVSVLRSEAVPASVAVSYSVLVSVVVFPAVSLLRLPKVPVSAVVSFPISGEVSLLVREELPGSGNWFSEQFSVASLLIPVSELVPEAGSASVSKRMQLTILPQCRLGMLYNGYSTFGKFIHART